MNELDKKLIEQAEDVLDLMEHLVSFYCDQELVSGQRVWTMINALASIKVKDYPEE